MGRIMGRGLIGDDIRDDARGRVSRETPQRRCQRALPKLARAPVARSMIANASSRLVVDVFR